MKKKEKKDMKKIYEKESWKSLFQQSWSVSRKWLMHDAKNNMMLWEWCRKQALSANHKSAFVISSSNFKYDPVVSHEKNIIM